MTRVRVPVMDTRKPDAVDSVKYAWICKIWRLTVRLLLGNTIGHPIYMFVNKAYDHTFADTEYGNPVAYGTAGDCYSMSDCPQVKKGFERNGECFLINRVHTVAMEMDFILAGSKKNFFFLECLLFLIKFWSPHYQLFFPPHVISSGIQETVINILKRFA